METGYSDQLAFIHDAGFGRFAAEASGQLLELAKHYELHSGTVVDLGCGSGILSQTFRQAGYDVIGVDISPSMIELARKRVPDGTFVNRSFLDFTFPPCDIVCSIGECLNYLFDSTNNMKRLSELFRRVYRHLRPGGLLAFDILVPDCRPAYLQRRVAEGAGWKTEVEKSFNRAEQILTRTIVSYRTVDGETVREREAHKVKLWDREQTEALLRSAGFRVEVTGGYGAMKFECGHTGYLALKPR